jgi:hypothetical protein
VIKDATSGIIQLMLAKNVPIDGTKVHLDVFQLMKFVKVLMNQVFAYHAIEDMI